jgi:lipopolysaccharide export LptBFGC system permease protein LptF
MRSFVLAIWVAGVILFVGEVLIVALHLNPTPAVPVVLIIALSAATTVALRHRRRSTRRCQTR